MRHSTPELTANVYTDSKLLDVHGALDAQPALPLDVDERDHQRATGTADTKPATSRRDGSSLAPALAPTLFKRDTAETIADKPLGTWPLAASAGCVK
jgi:hypothetical protein